VVKSNAYGHGLLAFSRLANEAGVDGFCVDAYVEGVKLRKEGIAKPILVLGPTLPPLHGPAKDNNIAVTVSNFEALKAIAASGISPNFHIKVDTGMHRQGFYLEDLPRVIKKIQDPNSKLRNNLKGIYTHFAAAKDVLYPTYTERQFGKFQEAVRLLRKAGFKNLLRHAAATGGALINKRYHCDAVRIGIGLYGVWPSLELEMQITGVQLTSILSWRTVISEVKRVAKGAYIGYDLTERVISPTKTAILPIGYWHGFPRSLSSIGSALLAGRRAKVLGRISMDLTVVDASGIDVRPGDVATLIGRDSMETLDVSEISRTAGTTAYEFLTRLNPLIERIIV